MIVTMDGPAGSGKSTIARAVAQQLQIPYLDTWAMYRALAYAMLGRGIDLADEAAVVTAIRSVDLDVDCGVTQTRVRVDGDDVTDSIRTMEVAAATSKVASFPGVRELMIQHQRRIGSALGSFVSEGRDQGGVVFPNADASFFLDASLTERAQRRFRELESGAKLVAIEDVLDNISSRDKMDEKQWKPLLDSGRAIVVDTTGMTIQAVVDRILELLPGGSDR